MEQQKLNQADPSNFEDEAIEREMGLLKYYEQEDQPSDNILNIQYYLENQHAFRQLLYHIYNHIEQHSQLADKIRRYLQAVKNPLLQNKKEEIQSVYKDLIAKRTDKLIVEGQLLGQQKCNEFLKQEILKSQLNGSQPIQKIRNYELRKKIQEEYQRVISLEKQIKTLAELPKISINSQHLSALLKRKQQYDQLQKRFDENSRINSEKLSTLRGLQLRKRKPKNPLKNEIVQSAIISKRFQVEKQAQPEKQMKSIQKFLIQDVNIRSRTYWILGVLFLLVHIFWRAVMI